MDVLCRLIFGHLLADFTLQTNFIAAWKRKSLAGLLVHATLHPIAYLVLAWPYLNAEWVVTPWFALTGWPCVIIAYLTHLLEDYWRIWLVNRGAPDNFLFYAWDQFIHLVVLLGIAPVSDLYPAARWPILGCLFVIATHFTTVTIYYVEKDLYGSSFPETEEKYLSMLYRLAAVSCFLLPGYWWVGLVVFMVLRFAWHVHKRRFDFSWLSTLLGNLFSVGCGLAARFVLYRL